MKPSAKVAPFRLIDLTKQKIHALAPGHSWCPKAGVRLTLPEGEDRILVELIDSKWEGKVRVDSQIVFDIATLSPMVRLQIADSDYVVLEPFAVFVRTDVDNESRRSKLAFAPVKPLISKAVGAKKTEKNRSAKTKLMLMAGCAAFASISLAATLLPFKATNQSDTEIKENIKTNLEPSVALHPEPQRPSVPIESQPDSEIQTTAEPASPIKQEENPEPLNPPATVVAERKPSPVAPPSKKQQSRRDLPPQKPKVPTPTPEEEKRYRDLLSSYQLEAGFDPEGVMQRLQALSHKVPHGTALRKDIDRAIQDMRNRL